MNTTTVFRGPTIRAAEVERALPGITVRGPAGLGDVLRAVQDGAERLAIIDGHFDHRQPVWHKEILWALSRGVTVYGAASMGALRAADLSDFGMLGVGRIYELFQAGWLERDDEVAVAHASSDEDYRPLSEALVNMRFTFRAAMAAGVVDSAAAHRCTEIAASIFYAQRSLQAVLALASKEPSLRAAAHAMRGWLEEDPARKLDQKRSDARQLLDVLREAPAPRREPTFQFVTTQPWNEFMRHHARPSSR